MLGRSDAGKRDARQQLGQWVQNAAGSKRRRERVWKSLGKHQRGPSWWVSSGCSQLAQKEKNPTATTSREKKTNKRPKGIAHASQLALNEQYKVTKPNHMRAVNARIKVAVVTLIEAAFGARGKQQPCLLVFVPAGAGGVLGVAAAAGGCSGFTRAKVFSGVDPFIFRISHFLSTDLAMTHSSIHVSPQPPCSDQADTVLAPRSLASQL